VKFLLDTPEVIYGCLEDEDFAGAGVRYATAFEVHKSLTSGGGGGGGGGGVNNSAAALKSNINKRFPLLAHQWPAVRDLKDRIGEAAQEWLSNDGGATASTKHIASTLIALAHLKPLDGVALLKTFLSARRNYVSKKLSAISSSTTLPSAQTELAAIATIVCSTIAQSGELFLALVGISPTPLVSQILQDELSSSTQAAGSSATSRVSDEVFFEPEGKPPPEAAAWKAHIIDMVDRLSNLSSSGVALECSQWLNQLGSLFTNQSSSSSTALTPCTNGKDLLAMESSIVSILDEWTYSFDMDSTTPLTTNLPWIDVSQWVLTKPVPLWPLLFEDILLSRAKELVQSDVSQAVHVVRQLLESSLSEAATTTAAAAAAGGGGGGGGPGKYCASVSTWSDPVYFQPTTPGRPLSASSTTTSRVECKSGGSGSGGNAWLSSVDAVCNAFDRKLAAALLASLDVCRGAAAAAADSATTADSYIPVYMSAAGRMTSSGISSGKSVLLPERSRVLQPYVQAKCIEAAEAVAVLLEEKATNVSKDSSSSDGIKAVSSALVLGRVAFIIAHQNTALSTALGPAEDWQAYAAAVNDNNGTCDKHGGGLKSTSAYRYGVVGTLKATGAALSPLSLSNEKDNPRLKAIQQRYLAIASSVHQIWAAWAGRGLVEAAIADLSEDTTLFSTTTAHVRGWAEIELPGEDDDAVHFPLPTAPSPAAIGLLLGACDEVERAGGCAVHDSTLRQLQWEVSSAFVSKVAAALDGNYNIGTNNQESLLNRMTEAGALQLLFDVRLIQDCLAGAQQPSPNSSSPSSSSSSSVAEPSTSVPFKNEYGTLETKLSSKLDPIDWATYEPHLYVCKDIYVQRSHVMLGMLLKTGRGLRSSSDGKGKKTTTPTVTGVGGGDTNILKMAPAGQRFVYLAVNTPAAVRKQAQQQQLEQQKMIPLCILHTSITHGGGSGTTITRSSGISAFSFPEGRGGEGGGRGVDPASAYSFSHLDAVTKAVAQAAHAAAAASSAQRDGHGDDDDEEEYSSDDEQGGVTAAGVGAAALEALKHGSSLFAGFSSSFKRDY